jgi:hypothetical protein
MRGRHDVSRHTPPPHTTRQDLAGTEPRISLNPYIRLAETGRYAGHTPPGEIRGMNSGEPDFRRRVICHVMDHLFKAL